MISTDFFPELQMLHDPEKTHSLIILKSSLAIKGIPSCSLDVCSSIKWFAHLFGLRLSAYYVLGTVLATEFKWVYRREKVSVSCSPCSEEGWTLKQTNEQTVWQKVKCTEEETVKAGPRVWLQRFDKMLQDYGLDAASLPTDISTWNLTAVCFHTGPFSASLLCSHTLGLEWASWGYSPQLSGSYLEVSFH